jgi:preprotein translocase subunit SecE
MAKNQEAKGTKKAPVKETKASTKNQKSIQKSEPKAVRRTQSQSKPNVFQRAFNALRKYFAETIGELHKVKWPTREEAIFLTRIVIVVVTVMSLTLGLLDYIYSQAIALLFR